MAPWHRVQWYLLPTRSRCRAGLAFRAPSLSDRQGRDGEGAQQRRGEGTGGGGERCLGGNATAPVIFTLHSPKCKDRCLEMELGRLKRTNPCLRITSTAQCSSCLHGLMQEEQQETEAKRGSGEVGEGTHPARLGDVAIGKVTAQIPLHPPL